MVDYRLYRLKDGHIQGPATILTCLNDEKAVERAQQLMDGYDLQLWEGARRIAELKREKRES